MLEAPQLLFQQRKEDSQSLRKKGRNLWFSTLTKEENSQLFLSAREEDPQVLKGRNSWLPFQTREEDPQVR